MLSKTLENHLKRKASAPSGNAAKTENTFSLTEMCALINILLQPEEIGFSQDVCCHWHDVMA